MESLGHSSTLSWTGTKRQQEIFEETGGDAPIEHVTHGRDDAPQVEDSGRDPRDEPSLHIRFDAKLSRVSLMDASVRRL